MLGCVSSIWERAQKLKGSIKIRELEEKEFVKWEYLSRKLQPREKMNRNRKCHDTRLRGALRPTHILKKKKVKPFNILD